MLLRKKIAELTGLPIEHQTRPLLTIYSEGDEYKNHFDYIPSPGQGGQRLKSIVQEKGLSLDCSKLKKNELLKLLGVD
jgi:hypothetical protein